MPPYPPSSAWRCALRDIPQWEWFSTPHILKIISPYVWTWIYALAFTDHGHPQRRGAHLPLENPPKYCSLYGGHFAMFFLIRRDIFLHDGLPPPPTKIPAGAHAPGIIYVSFFDLEWPSRKKCYPLKKSQAPWNVHVHFHSWQSSAWLNILNIVVDFISFYAKVIKSYMEAINSLTLDASYSSTEETSYSNSDNW